MAASATLLLSIGCQPRDGGGGGDGDGPRCDDGTICSVGQMCWPGEDSAWHCAPPGCGDGALAANEVCDDGNDVRGDGCSADCRSGEQCGNGYWDLDAGEVCDDGNTADGDGCASDCLGLERCGDGRLDVAAGEVCDDGNTDDGDSCRADCRMITPCGNGALDADEVCDDGNTAHGDGLIGFSCNPFRAAAAHRSFYLLTAGARRPRKAAIRARLSNSIRSLQLGETAYRDYWQIATIVG